MPLIIDRVNSFRGRMSNFAAGVTDDGDSNFYVFITFLQNLLNRKIYKCTNSVSIIENS